MRLRTLVLFVFLLTISIVYSQLLQDFLKNNIKVKNEIESTRRKKNGGGKYIIPFLLGALMIKSVLFHLAFKAMAVMTSIAVLLSTMSLIISSIVGFIKVAVKSASTPAVKILHKQSQNWAKDDEDLSKNYYTPENYPNQYQ